MTAVRGLLRTLLLRARILAVRAGHAAGARRPLRRRVLFATSHTRSLGGNLAILRDALAARPDPPEIVVLTAAGRARRGWRGRLAALRWEARAAGLIASSAVTVVDDYLFPLYPVRRRPGTTVIQAWHACGAFKRFGYSVADRTFGADATVLRHVRIHANYDTCLVSSMAVAPHYAEAFGQPLERFRADLGIPRTDVLFGRARIDQAVATIRHRYAIPRDRRVILYAPTFRGDSVGAARADGLPDWHLLRDRLADDHVLLVRLHPFIRDALVIDRELDGFVTDVSGHPDINELLHVADVLVTDYSSVIFEFALLGRPMVFYAPDLEAYERERGFYFDYRAGVPGPVTDTTASLADAIRDPAPDLERVAAFARHAFDVADGDATGRVVEQLILPALEPTA